MSKTYIQISSKKMEHSQLGLDVILSCKYRKSGKMENIQTKNDCWSSCFSRDQSEAKAKRQTDQRRQTAEEKQGSRGRQGGLFEHCSYSRSRKASQGLWPAAEALRRRRWRERRRRRDVAELTGRKASAGSYWYSSSESISSRWWYDAGAWSTSPSPDSTVAAENVVVSFSGWTALSAWLSVSSSGQVSTSGARSASGPPASVLESCVGTGVDVWVRSR